MALRLATDADAAPDPRWLADVEEMATALKSRGVGFYCVMECDGHREVLMSGAIDPDGIAGFTARVLAALADSQ